MLCVFFFSFFSFFYVNFDVVNELKTCNVSRIEYLIVFNIPFICYYSSYLSFKSMMIVEIYIVVILTLITCPLPVSNHKSRFSFFV